MADTKYILRYLPLFYEELEEKVVYIAEKLMNPQAANDFDDEGPDKIMEVRRFLHSRQNHNAEIDICPRKR